MSFHYCGAFLNLEKCDVFHQESSFLYFYDKRENIKTNLPDWTSKYSLNDNPNSIAKMKNPYFKLDNNKIEMCDLESISEYFKNNGFIFVPLNFYNDNYHEFIAIRDECFIGFGNDSSEEKIFYIDNTNIPYKKFPNRYFDISSKLAIMNYHKSKSGKNIKSAKM